MDGMASALSQQTGVGAVIINNTTDLSRALKFIQDALPNGAAYIIVQFVDKQLTFYRSGNEGYVMSREFGMHQNLDIETCVSLAHFKDCLEAMTGRVDVSLDDKGILTLVTYTQSASASTTSLVHTKPLSSTGLTQHKTGLPKIKFSPLLFRNLDVKDIKNDFKIAIKDNRVLLSPNSGEILWTPQFPIDTNIAPTAKFLRMVASNEKVSELFLTERDYWGAAIGDFVVYIKGVPDYRNSFANANGPSKEICQFTSEALMSGLRMANLRAGDTDLVDFDPKVGIVFRDAQSETRTICTLDAVEFPKFRIKGVQTALLYNMLRQTEDELIVLSEIETAVLPTYRFTRGNIAVNVKLSY